MSIPLYDDRPTVKNNLKCIKMEINTNLKISWRNDLRQSIAEQDILNLRNQLKIIKCSPELKMRHYRLNTQACENNL
jgi:hypothetical protein